MSQTHSARKRLITLACYGIFIAIGIVVTVLGPAKESLTQKFNMPLSEGGIFLSLHFLGTVGGILLGGWMLDRVNARYVLLLGTTTVGAGFMLLPSMPTRETTFLMMLVVGLGYGLLDIGPNMVVASLNRERASIALNLLNIMWGIGAALGPQVANLALNQKNINLAFILPGLLTLAMIPPFLLVSLPHDHDRQPDAQTREVRKKVRWSALLPFMLLMFAYVGAENGFGGWVFTELQLVTKSTESMATFANSLFWVGLTTGRIMASIVLRYITDEALILVGAVIVLVGTLGFMLLPGIEPVAILASFAIGVGCGPIFPTGLAVLNRRFPESRGAISGLVMSIGSLGAVAIPWLHGQVGRGLSGGLIVTVVLGAVMITLVLIIHRGKDEHPVVAPTVSPGADA